MKSEQLDKFTGKNVKIIFLDDTCSEGILGKGDLCFDKKWTGKGYHITFLDNPYFDAHSFKKSHVKRIEKIP